MKMILIARDGLIERRQFSVDQQMMMAGVRFVRACRRYAHSVQSEMNCRIESDVRAVLEADEIGLCAGGRWRRAANRGLLSDCAAAIHQTNEQRDDCGGERPHCVPPRQVTLRQASSFARRALGRKTRSDPLLEAHRQRLTLPLPLILWEKFG